MCGIAGLIERGGPVDRTSLVAMQNRLRHRGPDGEGLYLRGGTGLAHTRLSIIDLAGGAQPLFGQDGRLVLIANGEIYNEPGHRQRLEREGYRFATGSDCEVILPLYERFGASCVEHLRGMFAFALWDEGARKLLLGRDRMGEKPLYIYHDEHRFVFASELRALLASGVVPGDLDPRALGRFFRYQYVPEPETPFTNIRKLPAGHTLVLDADTWQVTTRRYWSMLDAPPIDGDPVEVIREALIEAVTGVLRSDVPVGLSLSGGLDSSAIAVIANRAYPGRLRAFSLGYPDAGAVDERGLARNLAQSLGIEFHDIEVDDEQMVEAFPQLAAMRDDPIADVSGYNYARIMEEARSTGTYVMLQGHGLDELCWGYSWVKQAASLNADPGLGLRRMFSRHCSARERLYLALRATARLSPGVSKGREPFRFYELTPYTGYVSHHASALFTPRFLESSGVAVATASSEYGPLTQRTDLEVTRLICDFYLLENGIAQGDRLSMAHSVEMRLPFVDHRLVEAIIGLRKSNRDDHLPPKHWLKRALEGIVPDEILNRPKRGFSPPMQRWQGRLRRRYGPWLRDGYLVEHGILRPEAAARLSRDEIRDGREATVSRMALTLEAWCRGVAAGTARIAAA
jgi:asparagine synthase (glutamine-hydrolysing)